MSSSSVPRPAREAGIDAFKLFAAIGVVQLHFGPYRSPRWDGTPYEVVSETLSFAARFAVPFFFVTSGYLLERRASAGSRPRVGPQITRVLTLFAAWSFISLAIRGVLRGLNRLSFTEILEPAARFGGALRERPLDAMLQGPEEHLWFLPALALGLVAYAAFDATEGLRRVRLFIAACFALLGLCAGPYGLIELPFALNPRNGPFLSFLMVCLGAGLARQPVPRASRIAWGLIAGITATIVEAKWLVAARGASPSSHDLLAGYLIVGPLLLLAARRWNESAPLSLAALGPITLGIYAVHPLAAIPVQLVVRPLAAASPVLAEPLAFGSIVALSLGIASWLARFAPTRPLVR